MDELTGDFLDIDENALDQEWIEQPRLYFTWAKELADARMELDSAKAKLEVVRAELDRDIRSSPDKYEIAKITETVVASVIVEQAVYKSVLDSVFESKHEVDVLSAAVTALEHRRAALGKLVDLHAANYFSAPKASHPNAREAVDEIVRRLAANRTKRSGK